MTDSGQLGGKDGERQLQGPRLDSSSPDASSAATVDDLTHYMQMVARYRDALIECATIGGADVSGGVPTSPSVDVWAVQEVAQLRKDYDEAIHDPA